MWSSELVLVRTGVCLWKRGSVSYNISMRAFKGLADRAADEGVWVTLSSPTCFRMLAPTRFHDNRALRRSPC